MDQMEFARAVLKVRARFPSMSVTSWFRSVSHNVKVGGVPTSRHLAALAVDVVWDSEPPEVGSFQRVCGISGLSVYREFLTDGSFSHDHVEAK